MNELTRRDAIGLTLITTAACACCALGAEDSKESSSDTKKSEKTPPPKQFSIGKLSEYPQPGFYDNYRTNRVMISRLEDRLVVMSAICTHKSCVLRKQDEKVLRCPCHKSFFSEYGTPTEGQAKIALPRYAVTLAEDGTIQVDTTQSFGEREWDNPKAFISLTKS